MVEVILCFYPLNAGCQFNVFCHWLYTYPPQIEGTETGKGLYIPMIIKITNISKHMEVSMTHNGIYVHIHISDH